MHQSLYKIALVSLMSMSSASVLAVEESEEKAVGKFSGNLALVNKYIYRGSEENDDISLQVGLEYAHNSGLVVGYWGSNLNYNPANDDKNSGIENDLYVAYQKQVNEDFGFRSQLTAYIYSNAGSVYQDNDKRTTNGYELINIFIYKDLALGASVMLADASYANAGDVYLSAAYSYALPYDISLNSSIGFNFYNDRRDDSIVTTTKDSAFTEARLGISRDLGETGLQASFDYVWGGKTRTNERYDDHAVFGITYNF